ncbi:MAG: hypothetical protein DMG30_09695 [Acidobacteria bacterium]|nr:MAG: hypothetical protein DMG30_09695 [Acidobacteriota bacterium]
MGATWPTTGLIVASGLARGIDSSAHRGACADSCGGTIGVLGSRIDVYIRREPKAFRGGREARHHHLASKSPIHVDELVESTGLSSSEMLAALCEMEMRGIIR